MPCQTSPAVLSARRQPGKGLRARYKTLLAKPTLLGIGVLAACIYNPVHAAAMATASLGDLSLEQLGDIVVTSVSRREERLAEAPASIFVITNADIRRSGATSIPEALRLAPNLNVARADTSQYAVSARGFNNTLANKMLILIDGRTVYTPLFSGVFWEAQNVMLEDVDRIEVISGPGATLWGANAVNGVINIIMRTAQDTQGALASVTAGTRESGGALRQGGKLGEDGHYRIYGKYFDRDASTRANGTSVADSAQRGQMGFRADWGSAANNFTLQGDAYSGAVDQPVTDPRRMSGFNLLGRWEKQQSSGAALRVQAYYDRTDRFHPNAFREALDTFDLEAQHALAPLGNHKLLWGGGYRISRDNIENTPTNAFLPPKRALQWRNVFLQDEIGLRPNLTLTLGAKVESNPYTGAEFLPSARLAWRPAHDKLLWGAVSRAVRAPSRIDRELFLPGTPPFALAGGPDFISEVARTSELGYRAQPWASFSYSVAAFYSSYDKLRSIEPVAGSLVFENKINGASRGIETWGSYQATETLRFSGGFTVMRERLRAQPDSRDTGGLAALGNDPGHWWMLRTSWDATERHQIDVTLRHVGGLSSPSVPSYNAVDARIGWKATRNLEIALTMKNLFDPGHPEWGVVNNRAEFDHSATITLIWRD